MSRGASPFLLRLNDDVRDITLRRSTLPNAVVSSSANPSLNGRLLESPPTFANGRTAIDRAEPAAPLGAQVTVAVERKRPSAMSMIAAMPTARNCARLRDNDGLTRRSC